MIVQICIGSACHLKGSYQVIQTLKGLIENESLEDQVTLKSSFCLGSCSGAVSVQIDDNPVEAILPDQTMDFFENRIKGGLVR
jgi:NADH:ubiquinone oxidoreductase subunit E